MRKVIIHSMTFLNPAILYGLPLAGIPLLIHFLTRYRRKRIPFSSLQFLKMIESRRIRRLRLQHWLLLALRTLALVCLILAFSRPAIQHSGAAVGSSRRTSAVMILDNSFSMSRLEARRPLTEAARQASLDLLAAFTEEDEIFLLTADKPRLEGPPYRGVTPRHARALIGEVQAGFHAFDPVQALMEARTVLNDARHPGREAYLISDMQAAGVDAGAQEDPAPDLEALLFTLPVGAGRTVENSAVLDVVPDSRMLEPRRSMTLTVEASRMGGAAGRQTALDLFLADARVARKTLTLPGTGSVRESVQLIPERGGVVEGFAEIERDALPGDDRRYFSLAIQSSVRVLLVRMPDDRAPFVPLAVAPEQPAGAAVTLETLSPAALQDVQWQDYNVVILSNIDGVPHSEAVRMSRAREEGLGVFILLGDRTDASRYNRDLAPALGLPRIKSVAAAAAAGSFNSFGRIDFAHPMFDGLFEGTPGNVTMPRVYFSFEMETGGDPIISLADGRPFLIAPPGGRTLVMAGAPAPNLTDLPVRGLFAPMLHSAVRYLASGGDAGVRSVLVGEPVSFILADMSAEVSVLQPDGSTILPSVRIQGDRYLVEYPGGAEPGHYRLTGGGQTLRSFSVNIDPAESDLTPMEDDALEEVWNGGRVVQLDPAEDTAAAIAMNRIGMEIGGPLLLAALLLLLVEMLVVRLPFMGRGTARVDTGMPAAEQSVKEHV